MRINKITTLASLATAGLCLVQADTAAATEMSLSYEETSSGVITGSGAGTVFTHLPAADGYTNTLPALSGSVPGAPGFSFYDDYVFTVAAATVDSLTSAVDLGSLSISNLEERVYSIAGNSTLPVVSGTPAGFQTDWTAPVNVPGNGATGMETVLNPTTLAAGTYVLEIRGDVTGSAGGAYSGVLDLQPVPLPAAFPLLLSGLGLLGGFARKRSARS
jgi:PEP-CTERM motif-containing protein